MQSEFPLRDSAEDATSAAIHGSGKAYKQIAHALWPTLSLDSAYARLKACLNPEKREKLTADEHLFIAVFCERFDFVAYCCQQTNHKVPERVDPEDEKAALKRALLDAFGRIKQIDERLEALS